MRRRKISDAATLALRSALEAAVVEFIPESGGGAGLGSGRAIDVPDELTFAPIDLQRDRRTYIVFNRDLMTISFGPYRFALEFGSDGSRYVGWMRRKQQAGAAFTQFAILGSERVGMFVVSAADDDPVIGYVNHLYLAPAYRGQGLGRQMERQALRTLGVAGFDRVRLSVAIANEPAVRFYDRQGWHCLGPRPGSPDVFLMEKQLDG